MARRAVKVTEDERYLLTISEFAEYQNCSPRTVMRAIEKDNLSTIKVEGKGRYRKNHLESRINYLELSTPEAQEQFLKDRGLLTPEDTGTDPEDGKEARYVDLKFWERAEADRKLAVVKEYLAALPDIPQGRKTVFQRHFAKRHGISYRALARWLKAYQEGGYRALVPAWTGGEKAKKLDKRAKKFIQDEYLVPDGPSVQVTYERYCLWCENRGFQPCHYETVRRYISVTWTPAEQLLIRNKEQYDKLYNPFVRRDWSKVKLMECVFSDGKRLDYFCEWRGKAIRPEITVCQEARSRAILAWVLTPNQNALAIGQSFVEMASQYGAPKWFYVDNGKTYKSRLIAGGQRRVGAKAYTFEEQDQGYTTGILRDMGTSLFFAADYNGREKPVESWFNIFTNRLKGPFNCTSSTKTRPAKLDRRIKTALKNGTLPSFEDLTHEIGQIIDDFNNRVHSATGRTPLSFFENFHAKIPSRDLLDYLLMDVHTITVRDSTVTIQGLVYRSDDLWKIAGEKVEVRRNPKDIRRAVIIYNSKLFCAAQLEEAGHFQSAITLESVKTCSRIRRQATKWRKQVIESEELIQDPLAYAVKLEEQGTVRPRDIRPATGKVRDMHPKTRLAKSVKKAFDEKIQEPEEPEPRHPYFEQFGFDAQSDGDSERDESDGPVRRKPILPGFGFNGEYDRQRQREYAEMQNRPRLVKLDWT